MKAQLATSKRLIALGNPGTRTRLIRVFGCSAIGAFIVACATAKVAPPTIGVDDPFAILAVPAGLPIVCRIPAFDSGARKQPVLAREFLFGPPNEEIVTWRREIGVIFDSVGHALVLSDEASFGTRGSQSVYALLDPTGDVTGKFVLTTVDSVALAAALARGDVEGSLAAVRPPVTRDLSPAEQVKTRLLGAWLWERRCGRN